jgi:hypothetical protein
MELQVSAHNIRTDSRLDVRFRGVATIGRTAKLGAIRPIPYPLGKRLPSAQRVRLSGP